MGTDLALSTQVPTLIGCYLLTSDSLNLTTRGENGALGLAGTLIFAPHRCVSSEEAEL